MKNLKLTALDTDQINKRKFDEALDADRVILVGQDLTIDSDKIAKAVESALSKFEMKSSEQPIVVKQAEMQTVIVEKPVVVPEVKYIEVPIIVREVEYIQIEKPPVIVEKVVTIEKPVVIKEIEIREIEKERFYPLVMKASAVIQAIGVIALILINLLKK